MNSLISYPRSGRTLTEQRMRLVIYLLTGDDSHKAIGKYIALSHGGFDVRFGSQTAGFSLKGDSSDTRYFLIRDAKGVINSHYYQTVYARKVVLQEKGLFKDIPEDQKQFIFGPWGVERYCKYLNLVQKYLAKYPGKTECLFFEDLVQKDFIRRIPKILQVRKHLSDEQVDFIYQNTLVSNIRSGNISKEAGRVRSWILDAVSSDGKRENSCARDGRPGNYQKTLSKKIQTEIDEIVRRNCQLGLYRRRYLS